MSKKYEVIREISLLVICSMGVMASLASFKESRDIIWIMLSCISGAGVVASSTVLYRIAMKEKDE